MRLSINKKNKQRLVSLLTAVAVIANSVPLGGLSEIIFSSFSISASAADYTPIKSSEDFTAGTLTFDNMNDYLDYCYYYYNDNSFAQAHQNDVLILALTNDDVATRGTIPDTYKGLGNADYPFAGSLRFSATEFTLKAHRAIFSYVYDSATILNSTNSTVLELKLVRLSNVGSDENKPLLADHVLHKADADSAEWRITLDSSSTATYSGVIGEVDENAAVDLKFTNNSSAGVVGNSDVGVICGKTLNGSTINLDYSGSASDYSVTASNGNAGGLVGTMEGTSVLNISSYSEVSSSVISNDGYSGGLVGELTSNATVSINSENPISVGGNITGTSGAGGLFGHYTNYGNKFDLSRYNITATVFGKYCGGVFGVLENNKGSSDTAVALTINNIDNKGTVSPKSGSDAEYEYTGYFGGIAGQYKTDDLKNSLILDDLTVSPTSQASFNAFGGAIGIVDSAAYIKVNNVNITASGTVQRVNLKQTDCENYAYFGGLVGATSSTNGVFVDVGNFALNTNESFCGGGIVGQFYNGVLRLSGTTDMTEAKPDGGYSNDNKISLRYSAYGQLVGTNDNVLVYALGDGSTEEESASYGNRWRYVRSNGAISDDLGTWGEVVRIFNVDGDNKNAEDANIVSFDSNAHTVKLAAAQTSIGSTVDFAKTALNIMLNQGGNYDCLLFTEGDENKRETLLLSENLLLSNNINLSNTGINGFMRDGVGVALNIAGQKYSINLNNTASYCGDIGAFTGTLNGGGHKIILAVGESYGIATESATEGTGQIYRHQFNGLFSVIGDGTTTGTVENLEIGGSVNVRNAGADGMNIGGIAARSHGSTTLDGIIASQTVNYYENRDSSAATAELGKNLGGLIGYVDKNTDDNGTINIIGTTTIKPNFNFSGKYKNWLMYGGAIGNVASNSVTINFAKNDTDKCTVAMTAKIEDGTGCEEKSVSGGLIGYIHTNGDYKNKNVNIKNLVFDSCTVADPASDTGGGLLGYSWLNTTVTIDGLTVTDATIECKNNAKNVGAMCYDATGVWKVNSLTVNKFTMSNGGTSSLSMLVNKAYNKVNNTTYGLYLDVLNSGYTLNNSGITLPSSLTVYDELAAYSAENVLEGGAGVISINVNADRDGTETKITETGTYQNQLTSVDTAKYANSKSRYYYNLDVMDNTKSGENLLLWSVNKYAASNISGEFKPTNSPLSYDSLTEVDLTGLSFYPLYNADSYTLKNLALTFDYSGIYAEENNHFGGTDSYIRDPGAANQHYLMHSGLFINVPTGKTVKVNDELSLAGTFLENDTYQGVVISGTMNGNFNCGSGSIKLDGIKPMTTSNAAYKDGYLLINNIKRESELVAAPQLTIKNLYTTSAYSTGGTTETVAKSLIGAASGKGLSIEFSGIKLDARDGTSTDSELLAKAEELFNAYGTYNSIFTDSTLLASINTDQTATLVYNYTYAEDWGTGTPRNVTYGKEVTDSKEYQNQENRYYGDVRYYTNPIDSTELSAAYDFSTGFLPYVKTAYSSTAVDGLNYRELKVNVMTEGLTTGCGTYNDPYVITDGKQLEDVASFILNGKTADLSQISLPKTYSNYDSLSENTSGKRWCTDGAHAIYKPNDAESGYTSEETGAFDWTSLPNVQYYLANAYYKISGNIELSDTFVGLGGTEANTAFRGVIVGDKNDDGTPKYTITNKSSSPFINVSNGCVVKDVNIVVDSSIPLNQGSYGSNNAYFGYDSKCAYYGGMIGEIMGGDNIIDNSYVSYNDGSKITLSGSYGMLCPVGSYVGVIVFGGLIFKNINATTANANSENFVVYYSGSDTNLALEDSKGAIYVNPLVGRVINGYAVNETMQFSVTEDGHYHDDENTTRAGTQHSLKNTTKHYTIADIDPSLDKLDVSAVPSGTGANQDGTINIPNSQAFFVLSLITQSCAGTATSAGGDYSKSLSYGTNTTVYGMSHNADYTNIGIATETTDDDYVLASGDNATNKAVPYIINRYTTNTNARCVTSTKGYYDINLKSGVTYALPDSFRGLGTVGIYGDSYNMRIDQFDGKSSIIDEDIYINRFQNGETRVDNYFDAYHDITTQSLSSNKYFPENVSGNLNIGQGIGLFNTYRVRNSENKIFDFTLTGSVKVENINTSGDIVTGIFKNITWLNTGGVCGFLKGQDQNYDHNYSGIKLNGLSINGINRAAGILADSGLSSNTSSIKITNCSADELSIKIKNSHTENAYRNTIGAFVGRTKESKVIINGDKENGGSTVKIKEFSSGKGTVGGLVGYAGNGCEVYDMKVCASDSVIASGGSVTLGNNDSSMSGGIVALMQPYTDNVNNNNCSAIFENCTVENINIKGDYAGGFYGGTWTDGWIPVSITIDKCAVIGNSETKSEIYGKTYAGGIVAFGRISKDGNPNVQISDTKVVDYKITASGSNYVGGMIGYCDSHQANSSVVCYMYNSSVENCILGTGSNHSGGIMGKINKKTANKILGYNVKLNNVTSDSSKMGAWVGYLATDDTTTSIQFSGMAIYGEGFSKNIGNWDSGATLNNASFVFADYIGKCNADSENSTMGISGFNYSEGNHVVMPKYPFVNINPQSKMGTSTTIDEEGNDVITQEIISGDGAVLYGESVSDYIGKTAEKTMAAKIYEDTKLTDTDDVNYSRRYTTFSDTAINGENTIDYYMKRTVNDDGDRISTYGTERGSLPSGVDDFAVVVIANTNDTETTNLINRYIQLVTNTTTDYTESSEYYGIEVNTCEYSDGKFAITDATPGLTWRSSSGTFALNGTYADSKKTDTFTLVDVQFKDPLNTDKIAYHLYVPIYTIKQMEVDFSVAVKTGTTSVSYNNGSASTEYSSLMNANGTHIDSLETWVTHYLRFTYSEDDINSLLNAGNVDWNHNKFVTFNTQSAGGDTEARLPESTFMVLVDPNGNSDEEYYANVNDFATYTNSSNKEGWTIDLTKFKNGEDSFKVKSLNTVIARNLNVVQNEGKGLYSIGTDDDYDVYRVDTNGTVQYYKYSANGDGNYDLSVSESINEDYYISMYVPKESTYNNQLYYYSIYGPSELSGEKSAKVNNINFYNVLVADLYEQETTSRMTVSPDDQQVSTSNKTITVKLSTSISIRNDYAIDHLASSNLYHSFNFSLNRYTESGVTSEIVGLDENSVKATYSIGSEASMNSTVVNKKNLQTNYLNIETTEIMSQLREASRNNQPFEIYSYVEMDFDENKLDAEFPQKGSESTIGVNVSASSNLAYDSERLAYTSMSKAFDTDDHYYYRESVNSAILYYSAVTELDEYESYGKMSQNQSRLGVNGYCSDLSEMPINTAAKYNVSAIAPEDVELAEKLRLTIMLSKKTDTISDGKVVGAEYEMVNMLNYLYQDIIITSGNKFTETYSIAQSQNSLVVDIPIESCDFESDIYNIGIAFKAKTGEGFTEYANYKITLRTELIKEDGNTIENSGVSDYVVYTNAKVYPTVLTKTG
ncbi:MAG: hypothetical protein ACI4I6_01115 [Hominimerdicola sp.]